MSDKDMNEISFNAIDLNKASGDKADMLKKEKEAAVDEGFMKIASFNGTMQDPYPSPFLNLSDTQIPKTTSEIFRWCKYFYTFDPLIAGAINALSTFPVTEVYLEDIHSENDIDGEDSDQLKLYKRIFFKTLNIHKLLIEIGIDYYLYGNAFIFGEMHKNPVTNEIEWKSMTRLDPSKMIIDYNPVTKEKKYKWQVSPALANIIKTKKPKKEYDKIPDIIKDSVNKNKSIILNSNNVYHFSRPTDSMGDNNIWGTPVPANVLKLLMYRNILRQAQEAIAREHIVPMRVYYLDKTQDYNTGANWSKVASDFSKELNKAVKDPNHKVVSPVPVNMINVGGNGRALLLTPEIEQIQAEILAGMNVPREFIFGGVSYSGSSISLKILENQFITYRLLLKDFMQNFVIKNMAKARKEWVDEKDDDSLVTVKMIDLKMQDDVQQKQLVMQLNAQGKCSDDYMWKVVGMDSGRMRLALQEEAIEKLKKETELKKAQMDSNYELQVYQMEIQAKLRQKQAEILGVDEPVQEEHFVDEGEQQEVAQGQVPQVQSSGTTPQSQDEGFRQPRQPIEEEEPVQTQEDQFNAIAKQLLNATKAEREEYLSQLPNNHRDKLVSVMETIKSQEGGETDMRPMPTQRPPRRDSLK